MKRILLLLALGLTFACRSGVHKPATTAPAVAASEDPYLWLEEVTGEKALAWVGARNRESVAEIAGSPAFQELNGDLLKIYDSSEKIPFVSKQGEFLYNFWQDVNHRKGIWRRTTLAEYRKAVPAWDVLLDLDALGVEEKESWVWKQAQILKPANRRCLITLSRGGSDASVTREFDLETRRFVPGGFALPEAKSRISWIDENAVYIGTDFGPGSMTESGYPRIAKLWKRNTPLAEAATIYEAQPADLSVSAFYDDTPGFERHFVEREINFFSAELFYRHADGTLKKLEIPLDAIPSVHREWLLVSLRTPWTTGEKSFPAGALIAAPFADFMSGKRDFTMLFEPSPHASLASYDWTKNHLILNVLEDVKSRLSILTPGSGSWQREPFPGAPELATVSVSAVDEQESDDYFMTLSDFITPTSLHLGAIGNTPEKLKQTPAFFDAKGLAISQHFAVSKDGTRIPYFQVAHEGLALDGTHPTLLNGYGGFEISEVPFYSGSIGRAWLRDGGVFVLANIRGGGEYGPQWHQAALKQNRLRAYEDFAAVAVDLIRRKVTATPHLGTFGGSNGGLLMGNMITQYPQLFGAVVCQVPLLDMKRYSKLLAGASWMAEYGDPDKPEEWAYIRAFSPYHNLRPGVKHPPTLFTTSTRDDRVHPGHARKMMARMREMGADVRYYENIEGGHGGAADNKQKAYMWAMAYRFFWQHLS